MRVRVQFIVKKRVTSVLLTYQAMHCADRYTIIILKLKNELPSGELCEVTVRSAFSSFASLPRFHISHIILFRSKSVYKYIISPVTIGRSCIRVEFIIIFIYSFFFHFCPHFSSSRKDLLSFFFVYVLPLHHFRFEQHEKGVVHGRVGLVRATAKDQR